MIGLARALGFEKEVVSTVPQRKRITKCP